MYDITAFGANTNLPDNSGAINAAINAAHSSGGGTVFVPVGRWKLLNSIDLKAGVTIIGDGNIVYNWLSPGSIMNGSILEVNHFGVCIFQGQATTVQNLGFDYPGQDASAATPTLYGATIQLASTTGNLDQKIIGNWFHKSFLAMDLRGSISGFSSGGLTVVGNRGCPLHGMTVDFVADWQIFSDNKFNAGRIDPNNLKSGLVAWVANNGLACELRGNDWVTLEGFEVWGYHTGCNVIPSYGYTGTGPYEFQNCSFDACWTGIQICSGTYNHPVKVSDCTFAPHNYATGAKGAAVAFADGADMSNGGLFFCDNYVFGPHNQVLWAGNNNQKPSNMLINGNICNAVGGSVAVWSNKGNNVQVMNNIFRGYSALVNLGTTTNAIVQNNQS